MKAFPMTNHPRIRKLHGEVSNAFGTTYNIGVDCIVYRDGKDRIGWHSDDTQGEDLVLCIIVDSGKKARQLKVQPVVKGKRGEPLHDGDEQFILFPGKGDAYEMDGSMQKHYEHSLPACKEESRRFALIFRNGNESLNVTDSGTAVGSILRSESDERRYIFGEIPFIKEGDLYSREYMFTQCAHRYVFGC
jgi:hypothetical protein